MPYNYFLQHAAPHVSSINFTLGNVKQGKLTFTWKDASESCPAVNYKILSNNCGDRPHTVNSSFVTCSTLSTELAFICTFTVQAVVCDNIFGQASDPIAVLVNSNYIYLVLKLITPNNYCIIILLQSQVHLLHKLLILKSYTTGVCILRLLQQ